MAKRDFSRMTYEELRDLPECQITPALKTQLDVCAQYALSRAGKPPGAPGGAPEPMSNDGRLNFPSSDPKAMAAHLRQLLAQIEQA